MLSISPRLVVLLTAVTGALVLASTLYLALAMPWLGLTLSPSDDSLIISRVDPAGPNAQGLPEGTRLTGFDVGDGVVPATPVLRIEEPDVLPLYSEYNSLMADSGALIQAARSGKLQAITDQGEAVTLTTAERPLADLPGLFWLQVAFGITGVLIGAAVWSVRQSNLPALLYFMTGIGYLIFAPAAAVYSTRELLIDDTLFRSLSVINHFGALFFTASLTALLWHYPNRIHRFPVATLCYVAAVLTWLADTWQLTASTALFHLSVLSIFALSFVFAFFQWLGTRNKPADRAALRWFLLSIYIATGLFAGVIIIPAALGSTPPASQGVMFGAFLIMYIGLAFGITRYRLFQLERWWLSIWAWFLSGLAIIAIDLMLVSFVAVSKPVALTLAVALVGWLYFPLRQWAWSRIARKRGDTVQELLAIAMPPLIAATETDALSDALEQAAFAVFDPLDMSRLDQQTTAPAIGENGLCLHIPDPVNESTLRLHHAERGGRLFTSRDITTARLIMDIYRLVGESLNAHELGVRHERNRIRQDIHDDLGARLMTLLHRSDSTDVRTLARGAIQDLRDLLSSMDSVELTLDEALLQWEQEARQRCDASSVRLDWQANVLSPDHVIEPHRISDLTRIIREAASNALRHASPSCLKIYFQEQNGVLHVRMCNDGLKQGAHNSGGRGTGIIRARARRLGGDARFSDGSGEWEVSVEIPLVQTTSPLSRA
ncbi:MAG: sensor histidine kinase [Alcanivoracaceae bacterium]